VVAVVVVAALRFLVIALLSPSWYSTVVLVVVQERDVRLPGRKSFGGVEERSGAAHFGWADAYLSVMQGYRGSDKALKSKGGAELHAAFGG
jgi:hypothetical protein